MYDHCLVEKHLFCNLVSFIRNCTKQLLNIYNIHSQYLFIINRLLFDNSPHSFFPKRTTSIIAKKKKDSRNIFQKKLTIVDLSKKNFYIFYYFVYLFIYLFFFFFNARLTLIFRPDCIQASNARGDHARINVFVLDRRKRSFQKFGLVRISLSNEIRFASCRPLPRQRKGFDIWTTARIRVGSVGNGLAPRQNNRKGGKKRVVFNSGVIR